MSVRAVAIWLFMLVGAAYYPSIYAPYQFDDGHSVQGNPAIRSFANIPKFFYDNSTSSTLPGNRVYRPITYTFYTFMYAIGGGSEVPFHLFKMLLHALSALALYLIWIRWFSLCGFFSTLWIPSKLKLPFTQYEFSLDEKGMAFFCALLFSIHPALSENVIYISATTSLLAATFFLWAYLAYWQWGQTKDHRFLWISLLGYALSVGSKEEGVTLVAAIAWTEWYRHSGLGFKARFLKSVPAVCPYVIVGAALFALAIGMNPRELNFHNREVVRPWQYFITQLRAWVWYLKVLIWPFGLNADNVGFGFSRELTDMRVWESVLLLTGFSGIALHLRKRFPLLLFSWVWFVITISPSSSFVALAEPVNEHRMYLPYVAMIMPAFFAFLWLVGKLSHASGADPSSRLVGWSFATVLFLFVIGTEIRNQVWANPELLWTDTLEKNPQSGRAMNNLAQVYMGRADWATAEEHLRSCLGVWPYYRNCHFNLGIVLRRQAKWQEAKKSLERARDLDPSRRWTYLELGQVFEDGLKDDHSAIQAYEKALQVSDGSYPDAAIRLARLRAKLSPQDLNPIGLEIASDEEFEQWFVAANADLAAKRTTLAIKIYRFLISKRPSHIGSQYNLGVAYLADGNLRRALSQFEKTVQIDPESEAGLLNLAFVAGKMGRSDKELSAIRALTIHYPNNHEYGSRLRARLDQNRQPSTEGD